MPALTRHAALISRLRRGPATRAELEAHLDRLTENPAPSRSTFHRDLRGILTTYGLDICYRAHDGRYYLDENDTGTPPAGLRLLEAFQIAQVLRQRDDSAGLIHFEARVPTGIEHLKPLLRAAREGRIVSFSYTKFWEDEATLRSAGPLLLKEARGRWYLLATDRADGIPKTFGLDRLADLEITNARFKKPAAFDAEAHFAHLFGALPADDGTPRDIVLRFSPVQARYVQTYPLHPSQKVLDADELGTRIGLRLCLSYDFVMELLSFGAEVEVLKPAALRKEMTRRLQETLALYAE
jgi:predicted DNA-binding transcriptional regulator YafY